MPKQQGALPDFMIRSLIASRCIRSDGGEVPSSHVGPASLDLAISDEVYRIARLFLPRPGERVRDVLTFADATPHDFAYPLSRDEVYIARVATQLALPKTIYGFCNPKSSTGRNDVHVRIVADGVARYDALTPRGFSGELWAIIKPQQFAIQLQAGETLSQARFFDAYTRLGYTEMSVCYQEDPLLLRVDGSPIPWDQLLIQDEDGSLILTLNLESELIGWEYAGANRIVDFSRRNHVKEEYFRPITRSSLVQGALPLRKGGFYILSTRELVRVPPHFACEMRPMDERSGEFRSHYAGFIDPGWGCGADGTGKGDALTLEVRPYEDITIRALQPIAKIRYERMFAVPERHYGELSGRSHYIGQRVAQLSKHFV